MLLQKYLKDHASQEAIEWLTKILKQLPQQKAQEIAILFSRLPKIFGKNKVGNKILEIATSEPLSKMNLANWSFDEIGRTQMLLEICQHHPHYCEIITNIYQGGDSRERIAILKSLALLPEGQNFATIALDAIRTNIVAILEAVACHNPFAKNHFNEQQFNNMVLKCVFMGIAISRIDGILSRGNQQLSRMANEYIDEREAAHRDVPPEIWLIACFGDNHNYLERTCRYLAHDTPAHRYWAAYSLGYLKPAAAKEALQKQLEQEQNSDVYECLQNAIANISSSF